MKFIIAGIIIIVVIVAVAFSGDGKSGGSSAELEAFAQCITDSGTNFYAAWYCPACNQQKRLFGGAIKNLNEIECANEDRSQTQVCQEANIQAYPTWEFADGTRIEGVQQLETLALATGCDLPGFDEEAFLLENNLELSDGEVATPVSEGEEATTETEPEA